MIAIFQILEFFWYLFVGGANTHTQRRTFQLIDSTGEPGFQSISPACLLRPYNCAVPSAGTQKRMDRRLLVEERTLPVGVMMVNPDGVGPIDNRPSTN